METKILYVNRDHYIDVFLGFDGLRDMEDFAMSFIRALRSDGEFKINLEENFEQRDEIPVWMIDCDSYEGLEEFIDDEFCGEAPMEFEFNGEKFKLELN